MTRIALARSDKAARVVSKSWTARLEWHQVVSVETIGGGRYLRYNLACSTTPDKNPAADGKGHLQTSGSCVTAPEPCDILGAPMSETLRPDITSLCRDCFPAGFDARAPFTPMCGCGSPIGAPHTTYCVEPWHRLA